MAVYLNNQDLNCAYAYNYNVNCHIYLYYIIKSIAIWTHQHVYIFISKSFVCISWCVFKQILLKITQEYIKIISLVDHAV